MTSIQKIVLGICALFVGTTFEACSQDRQLSPEEKAKDIRKKLKERRNANGKIHVEGKVVDDKGNLLDNVRIEGYKAKKTASWGGSKDTDISETVSGHFSLTFNDCASVGLDFIKDGYRRNHRTIPENSDITHFPYKKQNLKVILYKRWKIPPLKDYSATLEYKDGGLGTVIVIDPEGPPLYDEPTKHVENIHNPKALPKRSISMIPTTTEEGKIDTVQIGELNEHTRDGIYPKELRITLKAENGGFIKYDPKKDVPIQVQMCEAPKEGYKKEVVLSAETLNRMRQNRHGVKGKTWFYFRIGDLYGKGYFARLRSRNRSEHLKLTVELYLQPNGTRRVSPYMNPDKTTKKQEALRDF